MIVPTVALAEWPASDPVQQFINRRKKCLTLPRIASTRGGREGGGGGSRGGEGVRGEEIYSPVSGEIVAVNGELNDSPELINEDPYDEGWIFQVRVAADSVELLSAAEYTNLTSDDS